MPNEHALERQRGSVHRTLKARAAREGMSLSDFTKRELKQTAERPAMREWDRTGHAKPISTRMYSLGDITATAFRLDIGGALSLGLLDIVFVFLFVDRFDNVGTPVAWAGRRGCSMKRIAFHAANPSWGPPGFKKALRAGLEVGIIMPAAPLQSRF